MLNAFNYGVGTSGAKVAMSPADARRLRHILGRIGRCVLAYVLLHLAFWLAVSQTVEWEETFAEIMTTGMGMLLLIGAPTLLLAVFAAGLRTRMDVVRFRMMLAAPLVLCAWPLLAGSTAEPLAFQCMAQVAFAALIPVPLFSTKRQSEVGR